MLYTKYIVCKFVMTHPALWAVSNFPSNKNAVSSFSNNIDTGVLLVCISSIAGMNLHLLYQTFAISQTNSYDLTPITFHSYPTHQ